MERESCCGLTNLEGLLLDPINDILDAPICIGGMTSLTTIDFPGRLAAVVFCQGCPWRCRYCHNPHLQSFESAGPQIQKNWNDFLKFLEARVGLLDGIVFSGGEPTFQKNLGGAMLIVREMGFEIGLHTAGPDPNRLQAVLPFVDWVGMDIKAPFDETYDQIVGFKGIVSGVKESLRRLLKSGVDYQLRTTVHSLLLSELDLKRIRLEIEEMGAKEIVLQPFRPQGCTDDLLTSYCHS